ncbi:MAG: hypothetical protein ACK4VN_14900 [Bacteroidales bacterium]
MQYLLAAIFFSSCIILTFRLFSVWKIDNLQAITANYLIAAMLSFATFSQPFDFLSIPAKPWFGWSLLNGVFFIVVFAVFARSAQKAGVAITAVASKMSVMIPVGIGILIYGDQIGLLKLMGILFAFPAFYLIFRKKEKPLEVSSHSVALPLILFLGTGTNDSIMKHAQKFHVGNEYLLFLGTIFSISLLIGLGLMAYQLYRHDRQITLKNILAGFALGFFNYASTYYFLRSLSVFESSVFFPVFNVSIVSMGALIGLLIFKERLWWKNWLGIGFAIITILLIALAK